MSDSPGPDDRPSPWRWWVCGLLFLATTLNYMDRIALNQLALRIRIAFSLDNEAYSLLETGFFLAFGCGTLFFGWLVDRVSVRWVYPIAVFGWSIAGFLTGFAPGFWALFACRIGLGIFESGNWPCGIRTTRQVMPPEERSLGNSIFQSGTAIGAIVTPIIVTACVLWVSLPAGTREAHLAVGGGPAVVATDFRQEAWQIPFRVIGLIGLVWVLLWVLFVPSRLLRTPPPSSSTAPAKPFFDVFHDPRFWVLVVVICGVNTGWHTLRIWLPLFLQRQRGFSEVEMSGFMSAFYLFADVGSWTVGLATLFLTRRGMPLARVQVRMFAMCVPLVLLSSLVGVVPNGWPLTVLLFAVGFGALGLFPTYFALSQELSAAHQGKVTGTLGFINAVYMSGVAALQGKLIDAIDENYAAILIFAGVPAVAALVVLALFWERLGKKAEARADSEKESS